MDSNRIKFINTEVEEYDRDEACREYGYIYKESVFVKLDVSKSDITAMIELYGGGSWIELLYPLLQVDSTLPLWISNRNFIVTAGGVVTEVGRYYRNHSTNLLPRLYKIKIMKTLLTSCKSQRRLRKDLVLVKIF